MLAQIRAFLIVAEEGSISRAAERMSLSQSALSRQIQGLEHEMGGALLERTSSGIKLTPGGVALKGKMGAVLETYERAALEVRQILRGETNRIRIGYLPSAAKDYLNEPIKRVRAEHPGIVLKLLDLSPGEQIAAFRAGEIDVGLTDQSAALLAREFYTRELGKTPNLVVLPEHHPLAKQRTVRLAQLKSEVFAKADESQVPGVNRRVSAFCWKYGRFRPRYVGGATRSLAEVFQTVANEDAVAIVPGFARNHASTGVVMLPLFEQEMTATIHVVWQRGKASKALRTLLNALFDQVGRKGN